MNGSAGSSRPKRLKQELIGSNGAVPASEKENGDPVVGLAVRIVEIIATHIPCTRFLVAFTPALAQKRTCDRTLWFGGVTKFAKVGAVMGNAVGNQTAAFLAADGTFESGGAPFVLTPGDHIFGRKFRRN
jgi:hypothetical protein